MIHERQAAWDSEGHKQNPSWLRFSRLGLHGTQHFQLCTTTCSDLKQLIELHWNRVLNSVQVLNQCFALFPLKVFLEVICKEKLNCHYKHAWYRRDLLSFVYVLCCVLVIVTLPSTEICLPNVFVISFDHFDCSKPWPSKHKRLPGGAENRQLFIVLVDLKRFVCFKHENSWQNHDKHPTNDQTFKLFSLDVSLPRPREPSTSQKNIKVFLSSRVSIGKSPLFRNCLRFQAIPPRWSAKSCQP